MDKEKEIQETPEDNDVEMEITAIITELQGLANDWASLNTYAISEQAERLIINKARELVKLADAKKIVPKKSELPCNCLEKSKTLQEVIDEAKAELTDGKTFAAIVFRVD